MPNRFKLFLAALLTIISVQSWSQSGNYFLSHYSPSEERFDYVCFDMAQDVNGVMYFATKAGILEFDGRDWDLLQVQSAVYSIKINEQGEIFWAGAKGYGRISTNKHGFQQVETLSDSLTRDVFQSIVLKDKVYFLSDQSIYILDNKTSKSTSVKLGDGENAFVRIFELFDIVYANTVNGTFKLENGKLVPAKINLSSDVLFYSRINDNYVVGTADNKIFTCAADLAFKQIVLQDQSYIDASVVISGSWLNGQLLALGTLRGGVIFINPINGKTQEIINYATGLPA
jgi:hypothetical protein